MKIASLVRAALSARSAAGGNFGWWIGMIVSIIAAVRWFFFIPWFPIAALIVIGISILVIYGLAKYEDWFD